MLQLLVTRPRAQADDWVSRLRAAGWAAEALPLIDIAGPADPEAVRAARDRLADFALVVFVSPNAVARFFDGVPPRPWPAATLAGSPGPGTTMALCQSGVPAGAIVEPAADAEQFDSESLWLRLAERRSWADTQVLIVRGEDGRDWLARTLQAHGAQVRFVQAYRRQTPVWTDQERGLAIKALEQPADHVWLLSSSEALDHLAVLLPGADWSASRAVATHPRIAARARRAGFGRVDEVRPGLQPLLQALPAMG